jgi:tripartite-type tricarboxylate transporter receptor subunit TctC
VHEQVARIIRIPEVERRMNELGAEPVGSSPKALGDQVVSNVKMWAPIVKSAGARAD